MKSISFSIILILLVIVTGCTHEESKLQATDRTYHYIETSELPAFSMTRTLYIPAYSNLYYYEGNDKSYLTVVLSLRNTDFDQTIYITTADYYNSDGERIRRYLEQPLEIGPMKSIEYIVERDEKEGGAGANFIVEYGSADSLVNKPVVESIMIGSNGHHGFAFSSQAVEITK